MLLTSSVMQEAAASDTDWVYAASKACLERLMEGFWQRREQVGGGRAGWVRGSVPGKLGVGAAGVCSWWGSNGVLGASQDTKKGGGWVSGGAFGFLVIC